MLWPLTSFTSAHNLSELGRLFGFQTNQGRIACAAGLSEEDAQALINPATQSSPADHSGSSSAWPALGKADAAWDDDDDDRDQNGDHDDFLGAAALQSDSEDGGASQQHDAKVAEPVRFV